MDRIENPVEFIGGFQISSKRVRIENVFLFYSVFGRFVFPELGFIPPKFRAFVVSQFRVGVVFPFRAEFCASLEPLTRPNSELARCPNSREGNRAFWGASFFSHSRAKWSPCKQASWGSGRRAKVIA